MKSVLISIRPKWVEMIASGKKTLELRKNFPALELPFKCYIYCTKGNLSYKVPGGMICHNNDGMVVVGEFVCDKIEHIEIRHFTVFGHENRYTAVGDNPDRKWLAHSCLDYNEVAQYGKLAPLYGWHISELKIYDKPKSLGEFNHCGQNYHFNPPITRPPQSWCYVEEGGCNE